jgi:NADH-quinone oxidoreductase subunit J
MTTMSVTPFLFYTFAAVLLFSAFRVVTARNTVHAVLFLVLAFAQGSCLWMMLGAEFLSITLILVYVGAVMVLFMFVVMMLDIKLEGHTEGFWGRFGLAALIGLLIAAEMVVVLSTVGHPDITPSLMTVPDGAGRASNTAALGQILFGEYVLLVQIAACILLVAMVVAISLTLRERKDSKLIHASWQVAVKAKDRMEIIKMPVTQVAAPAPESSAVSETLLGGKA